VVLFKESPLLEKDVGPKMDSHIHGTLLVRESIRVIENYRSRHSMNLIQVLEETIPDIVKDFK
jgi:hypothetical protein